LLGKKREVRRTLSEGKKGISRIIGGERGNTGKCAREKRGKKTKDKMGKRGGGLRMENSE